MKEGIHYFCHFGLPLLFAVIAYPTQWTKAVLILWGTMLVDLDHLWATPIFDPNRCSINFHPLHKWYMCLLYAGMVVGIKGVWRNLGIGLLWHMATDAIDCSI